jgi:hypothetical protein
MEITSPKSQSAGKLLLLNERLKKTMAGASATLAAANF